MKWYWWVLIVIVLIIIGIYLYKRNNPKTTTDPFSSLSDEDLKNIIFNRDENANVDGMSRGELISSVQKSGYLLQKV